MASSFHIYGGGPSGSGKTHFVMRLLISFRTKIQPKAAKISYNFSEWQSLLTEMKQLNLLLNFKKVNLQSTRLIIQINL